MLRSSVLVIVLAALSAMNARAEQRVVGTIEGPAAPDGPSSPVILVPGFLGWRDLDVLGAYFIGLEDALEKAGADVYRLSPPPIADSTFRAKYLKKAIEAVLLRARAAKGANATGKVAIIAHSQGGIDVRVAMADPEVAKKIAVVVTLSSPHEGTEIADAALKLPAPVVKAALDWVSVAWQANQSLPITEPGAHEVLVNLSRAGMREMNARLPKEYPVPFFSLGAYSDDDISGACSAGARWGTPRKKDALHWFFIPGRVMIRSVAGDVSDDGVVPTNSMRFGTFLGCVPGDHVDWMGWTADRKDEGWTELDERAFLVELWRGMRDVELSGDARAMDAHVPALARLASAPLLQLAPPAVAAVHDARE
jgi:triacylglycerol lipase